MMGNLLAYSGIVAKVSGMQAKLLTQKEFEEIAELRNVVDVVSYLKEKPGYAVEFQELDENKLHRGDVEKMLTLSLYRSYSSLYSFSGMEQKRFLNLYLKRYEVELINYCLRIIFNHSAQPFDLTYKKPFFDRYSKISIDRLIAAEDISGLIDALEGTDYYIPLNRLREAQAHTLYDFDLALNLYYYTAIWKMRKKLLKGKELEIFTKDVGYKIDLMNLQWIYRAKKYYNMSPADIYEILIPVQYKLRPEMFRNLVEAATLEEVITLFRSTPYGVHYDLDDNIKPEQMGKEILKKLYLTDRRKNPYSIATINTYLFLKEQEIDKLTSALECIRYGYSASEVLAHIGGVMK